MTTTLAPSRRPVTIAAGQRRRRRDWLPFLMVLPALLLLCAVIGVPMAVGMTMSFQNIELRSPDEYQAFVGLANYVQMIDSPEFWQSLVIGVFYTAGVVIGSLAIGWALALLLNKRFFGRSVVRAVAILPWAIPGVAGALIWQSILDSNFGILNAVLGAVLGPEARVDWLLNTATALPAAIAVTVWDQFPLAMMMILAGLQTVPKDLYEAAAMDGASALRRFVHVTWPQLRYVTLTTGLIITIWAFRRFTTIFILTRGGPAGRTETLVLHSYREAFSFFNLSYAATLGVAAFVISMLFTVLYVRSTRLQDER